MKNKTKYLLQKLLGFDRYLRVFSRFKIATLRNDKNERDFLLFLDLLKSPKHILDIGANIGVMTVYFAERFPNAIIHSIEPSELNMSVLKYAVERKNLKNVLTYQVAVGDTQGTLDMVMPVESETKLHGLTHVLHESIDTFNEGEKFRVSCETIDFLFQDKDIDAIKIDVENYEYFVFKGAKEVIQNSQPVIYAELWDNDNRKRCFEILEDWGYHFFSFAGEKVIPWQKDQCTQNFLFVHQDKLQLYGLTDSVS